MIRFDLVSIKPCNLILQMRIVHATLISETLLRCDSGVHVENRHDSISASIMLHSSSTTTITNTIHP